MKRRDLIKQLEEFGCVLVRHGAKHDWYTNPITKQSQPVATMKSTRTLRDSILRKLKSEGK